MHRHTTDQFTCWLTFLEIFALQNPFGLPVKITVSVAPIDGESVARRWGVTPLDVVDGYGRPAKQVQTEDKLIAIEWLVLKQDDRGGPTATWGMMPLQLPKKG